MVFGLEPGPEDAVQRRQLAQVLLAEVGQECATNVAEEALDLAATAGLVRSGVDQGDAQGGADQPQVVAAVHASVVAVQPPRDAASQQRLFERVLEAGRVFGEVEASEGHQAGGVVDEGVQVGLGAPAPPGNEQPGTVHHVGHPQIAGVGMGEGHGIGLDLAGRLDGHAVGGE